MMPSRRPPRSTLFENDTAAIDNRGALARDPHRPSRPTSGDRDMRADGYPESPYHPSRPPPPGHAVGPRSEARLTRVRSPVYPSVVPPRGISNASPLYDLESADASLHRDKRARLEGYTDRMQTQSESSLRPPPLRSSSSHRFVPNSSSDWVERGEVRERRPRDLADTPYHGDGISKASRSFDRVDAERAHSSRRTSPVSHHTLDASFSVSSEPPSTGSQSSKVKRRKRAVLSCTECKQRKIKCDRNVPNCGSCVRRGVAHLCRWGDERDFLPAAPASNITPSNAALMARIAQLESQVRVLQSSSSSPSAAHEAGASERSSNQPFAPKYGGASESSSGRSSRFSGLSSVQYPPDFTSRDRTISDRAALRNTLDDRGDEEEDDSQHSDDSEESGDEDAGDLLRVLAQGTSLKIDSRNDSSRQDEPSTSHLRQVEGRQKPQNGDMAQSEGFQTESDSKVDARSGNGVPHNDKPGPRLSQDEALASSALLNIFTAGSWSSRSGTRRSGLVEALELLPPRHKTEALIEHYLREAEPIVHSIHKPSLLQELESFWAALDRMKDASDSASPPTVSELQFGAMLLAMCEAACEFMTPAEVLDSEICKSRNTINDRLHLIARACLALLGMGHFVRHPTIWGMQAVILLRHYSFNRDHREEYTILATMAIKAAEYMGLNRLGSALKDEERWQDEKRERMRMQAAQDGKEAASSSTHRWKMLTSTQIHDGHETESDGEDLDPDRVERKDMNAMWLPRGARRRRWDLAAAKRYKEGSRVSREHGRKVWFAFVTLDWLCAAHFDRCYHCKDEMFTTQSPQNIDDADVMDDDLISSDGHDERPSRSNRTSNAFLDKICITSIPTTNSFISIHIEICHTVRSIADALNHGDESFDTVLAIEARFREILRSLPRFFKLDGESEYDPEIHRFHQERPYLSLQRAIIHEYVHHRLLKLHRLYMSRGYWNAKYIHSTRTCIESARVVIGTLRALDHAGCRGQRYWIFKFHIFHAVLALQVDLLYLAKQPVNREILAKRADVVAGLKMLHARTDVEGRNPVLASSLKVIKVLREEEQARRAKNKTATAEVPAESENTGASSPMGSVESQRKCKIREWTGASESTGDLADHLERRIKETWYTVDAEKLRARAEATSNLAADARPPLPPTDSRMVSARSKTPSTEDASSIQTAAAGDVAGTHKLVRAAASEGELAELSDRHTSEEGRDTELDEYLKLLSSYQNPDDAPDGAHFFDVLDDMVFENQSASRLNFGKAGLRAGLGSEIKSPLPLLRARPDDLFSSPSHDDVQDSAYVVSVMTDERYRPCAGLDALQFRDPSEDVHTPVYRRRDHGPRTLCELSQSNEQFRRTQTFPTELKSQRERFRMPS
ncbi:hypothetical protein PHSY_000928 [Pseudozyma hubeiensis SY62]|uniref:Zn(2)-C6 fungal-type domain-containing protein n=1 Tax=Pseudozyma hubeiensis (strain SY62) TaxID=1305764 RepID=R9NXG4_PSEHS|nr:hypothetical protein PHSY_000928 [Pseudozyma hubeiensis SY62]GAC93363.1 hypothetical protein PHSY_000928 [Pseudozyma hubeiensis SY62]